MYRQVILAVLLGFAVTVMSQSGLAGDASPELVSMVTPLDEVEAMLAEGAYADGKFSSTLSYQDASAFAQTVKKKLATAKSEYSRLPKDIRKSKEADNQWYRMDALIKTSKGIDQALRDHSTAVRAQQKGDRARDVQAKADQAEAAKAQAAKAKLSGPDWQNSYIPNIKELESHDGFFQWPWSAPSWEAVVEKAEQEQEKGSLGPEQVEMFKEFILSKVDAWPAVPRVDDPEDAEYALEMIEERESESGLEVEGLWISRGDWKIQRNALGAIISRSKPGYILYEDPSGEGCILKELWIQEPYAGDGRYEQTSKWRYAKLRFQSCDRR
jgi:hypothetical protein